MAMVAAGLEFRGTVVSRIKNTTVLLTYNHTNMCNNTEEIAFYGFGKKMQFFDLIYIFKNY